MSAIGSSAAITPSSGYLQENSTANLTSLSNGTDDTSGPGISVADTMAKIYIAVGTFGMAGNLLVIGIILASPNMRKMLTNKYIVNQSSIDFFASLFLLLGFATVKDGSISYEGWKGDVYCLVSKRLLVTYVCSISCSLFFLPS